MKNKRGGQPGNQNARKHGFYSPKFTTEQLSEFWRLVSVEKQEPEIAAIRVRFVSALGARPGDRRIIRQSARLMSGLIARREGMTTEEAEAGRKQIIQMFDQYIDLARALRPIGKDLKI